MICRLRQVLALAALLLPASAAGEVKITTAPALPDAATGQPYSVTLQVRDGVAPLAWSVASGTLPPGLVLGPSNGAISGTPTTPGRYSFVALVRDAVGGTDNREFRIFVRPLVISTESLAGGQVGLAYSQTLVATGGVSPYTWRIVAGSLPSGLTLDPTGAITGTPTTAGSSSFTVGVTDAGGATAWRALTISISPAPLTIPQISPAPGTVGKQYSQALSAAGGMSPYTWSLSSGSLPPGLTLSTAGVIEGVPTSAGSFSFTVTVRDAAGASATSALLINIDAGAPSISPNPLASAVVNVPYTETLAASGGTPPYSWRVTSGNLPPGLALASNGTVSGTPTAAGSFSFEVSVTDAANRSATRAMTLVVSAPALAISTSSLPPAEVSQPYSQAVIATGGTGSYTWTLDSGTLPAGLTLSSSGSISGTPTSAGDYGFVVKVTDSGNTSATRSLALKVNAARLTILTSVLPQGKANEAYSQTLSASGGTQPYTWTLTSGTLPQGLTLSTSGLISGIPSATGASDVTVTVSDTGGQTVSRPLTLVINAAAPSVTTTTLPNGSVNQPYAQTLAGRDGTPPYSWTITSGSLPPGLTLAPAGSISGTPSAAGTYSFTATMTDSGGATASRALTIAITPVQPTITTSTLPNATVNQAYSQTLSGSGGTAPYTWGIAAGTLPSGLTLAPSGTIAGSPSTAGTFEFTASLTDAANVSVTRVLTLIVTASQPTVTTSALPAATLNQPYSQTLAASGGTPPYTWSVTAGSLPPGLILAGSGAITGSATSPGLYNFTATLSDSAGVTASRGLTIAVNAPPIGITTSSLPGGTEGQPYSQSLAATGGAPPYTWSVASGALPAGLTLSPSGTISGTATTAGNFSFSVRVADTANNTQTRQFNVSVAAQQVPLSIGTGALTNGTVGARYSQMMVATGGTAPYVWSLATGALPPGLTLAASGAISGTPTIPGSYDFTVQLADSRSGTITKAFRITIAADVGTPSISSTFLTPGVVGRPYSQQLVATGGRPPYAWSVSAGNLPAGIALDASTGVVAGSPEGAGAYIFTARVADADGRVAERVLEVRVAAALSIASCPTGTGTTGVPYEGTVAVGGGISPYLVTVEGSFPVGLVMFPNGKLSGTALQPGTYGFTVRASDASGQWVSRPCTITVQEKLRILQESLQDASAGAAYSQRLSAVGGTPPYRWSTVGGGLPPGVTLDEAAGVLAGQSSQTGRFTVAIVVSDASGLEARRTYDLNVAAGLAVAGCPTSAASVGQSYRSVLSAAGGRTPYTWRLASGALTDGLALASESGVLAGTPAVAGTVNFTIAVADASGSTATRDCSIQTAARLTITTETLADGRTNAPYARQLAAAGGIPPYLWSVAAGTLPSGLSLNSASGEIVGAASAPGDFNFTVAVVDSLGVRQQRDFRITVSAAFAITACPSATIGVGEQYASAVQASATGGMTWSLTSGTLPPGLALDDASGIIAGTASTPGTYEFVVQAVDSTSAIASRSCTISVMAAQLRISAPDMLADAFSDTVYEQAMQAQGGRAPYVWSIADGRLPDGMSLSQEGFITGTPSSFGTHRFTLRVTDADAAASTRVFELRARPGTAPAIRLSGLPEVVAPAQQPEIRFTLESSYPVKLRGRVNLQFTPDPGVDVDDRSIRFVTGDRTIEFEIPANAQEPVLPVPQLALQTGTVAGRIDLVFTLWAGDVDVTPPASVRSLRIDRMPPVITSARVLSIEGGIQVVVTGYSTTREVSRANFQFTPAAGSSLQTATLTIDTADAAREWFGSSRSNGFGGQFTFVQPFTVQGAALSEVSITLASPQGTSAPSRVRF